MGRPREVDWVDAFLAARRLPSTRASYGSDLRLFAQHVGGRRRVLEATVDQVAGWRDQMAVDGLSPWTIRRRLATLRSFFEFVVRQGGLEHSPAEHVESPDPPASKATTPWIEAEDARRVLEAPDPDTPNGLRDQVVLTLLFRLGLRRSEVVGLRLEQVTLGEGARLLIHGKRGKIRDLGLESDTVDLLRIYLREWGLDDAPGSAWLLPSVRQTAGHLSGRQVDRIVKAAAAAAEVRVRDGERLSPHGARRTFATIALDRGVSLDILRRAMGHSDPRTTVRYDLRTDADLEIDYGEKRRRRPAS